MSIRTRAMLATLIMLSLATIACGGFTSLFATPTPTATTTPTSTPTPLPTPTPTVTPTPLPTGVQTETGSDGTTLVTDYDNQFQMSIGPDWKVVPITAGDLASALSQLAADNPAMAKAAQQFESLDPNAVRVVALNTNKQYLAGAQAPSLTVTVLEDKTLSALPMDMIITGIQQYMEQEMHAKILSKDSGVRENANGVEIGSFDFTMTISGQTARATAIAFKSQGKFVEISIGFPSKFAEALKPEITTIADSIRLMNP